MPSADETAARLRLAATRLHRRLRREAGLDLTPSQISALATIANRGPITLGSLAEHESVSAPSITKVINVLQESGLVAREADPSDRRVNYVTVTPEGAALVAESRRRKTAWLSGRIRELTPEQRKRLDEAIDVIEALTQKETAVR